MSKSVGSWIPFTQQLEWLAHFCLSTDQLLTFEANSHVDWICNYLTGISSSKSSTDVTNVDDQQQTEIEIWIGTEIGIYNWKLE